MSISLGTFLHQCFVEYGPSHHQNAQQWCLASQTVYVLGSKHQMQICAINYNIYMAVTVQNH